MNKFKMFVENFFVYGLGGIINRIIPFIMLPIITRLMPNTLYFGLNDISTIVVSFGSALAIMGMYDAMFRMFFEKEDILYKKTICSTTLAFTLFTTMIVFFVLIIFKKPFSKLFFGSEEYLTLFYLSVFNILIGSTNSIISAPTRMNNKRNVFLLTNTISPLISYSIAIPLLLKGYYIIALPLASLFAVLASSCIFGYLNRSWFSLKYINFSHLKPLLVIALPLLPNFLIYWIFNSCDRLMIAKVLGNEFTGIYAVGAKLGHISQLIYVAFAGGWQFFAFSTMKDKDQVVMTSNIFEYLGIITYTVGIVMVILYKFIFSILFTGEYLAGDIVSPYLFIAPLFLMMYQVADNQLLVIKKTWPSVFILLIGAVSNVLLNSIFIAEIGIEGAAIATVIGYAISVIVCVLYLQGIKLLAISNKFIICSIFFVGFLLIWRLVLFGNILLCTITGLIFIMCFAYFYRVDIKKLYQLLKLKEG